MKDALSWLGVAFCVSQSALFSGSNIAVFSLSRLRLEAAAAAGDKTASSALELRRDANFRLVTILMGNVAINVLLTMLADSVMAGVLAFLFSTAVITALGEIGPQACFSGNALRAVAIFAPVLRFYRMLFWPLAKPTAVLRSGPGQTTRFQQHRAAALRGESPGLEDQHQKQDAGRDIDQQTYRRRPGPEDLVESKVAGLESKGFHHEADLATTANAAQSPCSVTLPQGERQLAWRETRC
ncbi:MAG: DUF21 domain-containing protein [Pseudomonadota bacterium]